MTVFSGVMSCLFSDYSLSVSCTMVGQNDKSKRRNWSLPADECFVLQLSAVPGAPGVIPPRDRTKVTDLGQVKAVASNIVL